MNHHNSYHKSIRMYCRLHCIFFTFYTTTLMFLFACLIFWIIISPSNVKFYVTDASLTQFNLTTSNTLYYNFKVNITARNPNNNIIVYYRRITAIAWYKDRAFGSVTLAPFEQGYKNTSLLQQAVFEGQSVIDLKPKQIDEHNMETSVGYYNDLAVDLDFRIRAKFGRIMGSRFNPPIVQCKRLRVPLMISNGRTAAPFNGTKCRSVYFFVDRNARP